jgi:ATP phosphoribosyltransferase regulatory subunit HisZ
MGFGGASADVEAAGDFLAAQTLGDAGQDFALAIGQIGRVGALPVAAKHLVEGDASNVGAEEGLASFDCFHRNLWI